MTNFYSTAPALQTKKFLLYLLCGMFCVVAGLSAHAQSLTINPRSSLVLNGNITLVINNAALKNNGTFTASTSTVKFSGNSDTVNSYVSGVQKTTFHNLSIIKAAYGVALKSSVGVRNVLAVTGGNLYTDSNLTLLSDAALTARVDVVPATSLIIGKAHVERYVPARRAWRMMTGPVTNSNTIYNTWQNKGVYTPGIGTLVTGPNPTGVNGNGLDPSYQNNISVKTWNAATQAFGDVKNTKVALSQRNTGTADNTGYFIFVRGDRDPNNTFVPNTNITTLTSIGSLQTAEQTFAASSSVRGYTLIGNPYASPIDFNKVARKNLVKRFYVWDPTINVLGAYVMLDDLDNNGTYIKSVDGSQQTKDIQSSQAFFVETIASGEANITFQENSKTGNNNNMVFRPLTPNTPAGAGVGSIRTNLNLLEADNSTILADGALVEFNDIYSILVDSDDAIKLGNINENIGIQRYNSTLTAERRPALTAKDTVFFKLSKMVQRSYQLEFVTEGLQQPNLVGFLEDSYLQTRTIIDLNGKTKVNFSITGVAASAVANRFRIVFMNVAPLPVTISSVTAYQKNSDIAVDWKVENEINMVKYDVEKSTDGSSFVKLGTVNVSGTNNTYNSYSWLDVNAVNGTNFYRIKTYDNNGQVNYTAIVKVTISKTDGGFSIYPNPVKGSIINLQINNEPVGVYQLRLTNSIGQTLYTNSIRNNSGSSTHALNTGSKLPAGAYQLEIIGQDNNHNTQKVIVE
ncbi:MAG: T9SS type A sorting domain-containing protein [Ferruginibacter sp.]